MPIIGNQMEKKTGNEMESGMIHGWFRLSRKKHCVIIIEDSL